MAAVTAAVAAHCRLLLLFLLLIPSPSSGTSRCTAFTTNTTRPPFATCTDLPHLGATLHWTYNATAASLSLLFLATPPTPNGWVAWGINPSAQRMVGTQALLAFRRPIDGAAAAATVNVSGYYPVLFGSIAYEVSEMEAVAATQGRKMGVFATVRLPPGTRRVNHTWQVGPAMRATGPAQHYFDAANLEAVGVLDLMKGA